MSTNHLKFRFSGLAGKSRLQPPCQSVFTFIWAQIEEKEQMQCIGTRNNYMHAFRRFKEFRSNEDVPFSQMTPDLMEQYRAWLLNRGLEAKHRSLLSPYPPHPLSQGGRNWYSPRL